ncbi:PBS lyase [Spirochaetia bacterium]|nr:PBS lyase [Spirochaetia bacterium]
MSSFPLLRSASRLLLLGLALTRSVTLPVTLPADDGGGAEKTVEAQRLETIRYGTESEIAALIQTIKTEKALYLDDELITLVQNTRNRNILTGVFSFFADRERGGLEERALRAIEERDDETNETVLAAIDYLGKVRSEKVTRDSIGQVLHQLEDILDSEEQRFMNTAFRALGRVGGAAGGAVADEVTDYVIDYYTNRMPGSETQREMIVALGETGSKQGVSFLGELVDNNDERATLRMAAIESLAKIGDSDGLDPILRAVSSQDPNIRSTAVGALGPFSGPQVDDAILEAFRDSYYRTRISAATAARERKLESAVPYLVYRAERDDTPAVKDEAIRALGAIGNGEATATLESLLLNRKNADRVRILAAETLIQNNADVYTPKLIIELDEANSKKLTALYNGFLRVLGSAKTGELEPLISRFYASGGVIEKSYALDMTANNNFRNFREQVEILTDEKNGSLSRKALAIIANWE